MREAAASSSPSADAADHLTAPALSADGLRHGFFTRNGGVSRGIYASLNCGVGSADEPAAVAENRARAARAIGCDANDLATPYQVHGRTVAVARGGFDAAARPRSDAVVTDRPGVVVGVGTADCGPVLLADAHAGVVAAAHAGWRGAVAGVVEAAVAAMVDLGAERSRIAAVLGPTISQVNYEVGDDMRDAALAADPGAEGRFAAGKRPAHYQFDLPGYIVDRLDGAGVGRAEALHRCTYAEPDAFFSYRRTTHEGLADYGRMLAAIALV